jgi:hypothetical protein
MVDVVLLARVNHAPSKLEQCGMVEIPIKVNPHKICFLAPTNLDDMQWTGLKKKTIETTEINFPAREGAIERKDTLLIEGIYNSDLNRYDIQRVHVCAQQGGNCDGMIAVISTFRNLNPENVSQPYKPASNQVYNNIGIWTPF